MIAKGGARPGGFGEAHPAEGVEVESTRLTLESAGKVFIPLVGLALLLAWGAGGLALLLATFGLAAALLAPLFAWRNLRGLGVRAAGPGHHLVGENFLLELDLYSRRRVGSAHDLLLAVVSDPRTQPRPAGHVARLDAGQRLATSCAHRWLERGRQRELLVVVYSSFPFGLFRYEKRFRLRVDFLALPRLGSLADLGRLPAGAAETSVLERRIGQLEDEFYQLREWREGMSLRRVHWKLSARRRRPILRDLRSRAEAPVSLVLHAGLERRGNPRRRARSFETAVCLVATLGEFFLRRGRAVRLTILGENPVVHPKQSGRAGLFHLLAILAEVRSEEAPEPERVDQQLEGAASEREATIAVLAAGGRYRPKRHGERALPMIIDVEAAEIDSIFQRGRSWGATPVLAHGEGR